MVNNIELRREYVKLVQQGKTSEAFKKLQEIWSVESKKKEKPIVVETVKSVTVKPIIKENTKIIIKKVNSFKNLSKIKGIGKETVKDISSIYESMEDLISALKAGKNLPLRNDVEDKLRKELL